MSVRIERVPSWAVPKSYTAWVPWPNTILWDRERPLNLSLLAHELVHVSQWARYGWTFPFRYMAQLHLPHDERPLEVEAWELASTPKYAVWAKRLAESVDWSV